MARPCPTPARRAAARERLTSPDLLRGPNMLLRQPDMAAGGLETSSGTAAMLTSPGAELPCRAACCAGVRTGAAPAAGAPPAAAAAAASSDASDSLECEEVEAPDAEGALRSAALPVAVRSHQDEGQPRLLPGLQ